MRLRQSAARMTMIGGDIIPGTAEWLPSSSVDSEGRVKEANQGFQTQVYVQPKPR